MRNAILALASLIALMPMPSFAQVFGGYNRGTSTYQAQGPSYSQSPNAGYQFKLNGKVYATDNRVISGPNGCNSDLVDMRTGRTVCPLDRIVTPQSAWARIIWNQCRVDQYGDGPCVGGFVAVGRDCPQNPGQCRYYRIVRTYDGGYGSRGPADVNLGEIDRLGNELWIERPGSGLWKLFMRCHAMQESRSRYYGTC